MKPMKLTKSAIDRLPAPNDAPVFYRDAELRGFGVKVFASGVRTFFLEKKINGRTRRIAIGRYGELTAEQARKEAVKLAGLIATGSDPVADKARQRLESRTLREVFEDYLEARKDLKPLTIKDMGRALKETFPDWLDKPLAKITAVMIERRHRERGAQSKARANLAMRYLRALFNFAAAKYQDDDGMPLIENNPVKKLSQTRAWYRVDRRQSVIKPHELGAWVNAVLALPNAVMRDYYMTVLLTGMRREEALSLTWDTIDLTARTLTVVDPKNHRDHTLPLSDYLTEMLKHRKSVSVSALVFADAHGRRISNFRYAQAAVEKAADVSFCIHDLRRTFITIAESLDIPAYALKRLLNHKNAADVTTGYIVMSVERLRKPMQQITDFILAAAGVRPKADIVTIPRSA